MSIISQPITAKKGEVSYRRSLYRQHCKDDNCFNEEYSTAEMQKVIDDKIKNHTNDFTQLQKTYVLSPFLEIGAGYAQSSLVLANVFSAKGYAVDIALAPLKSATSIAKRYAFSKLPALLVADAERLPFADNSFPFIFCYQTLHHFPNPKKVISEVHRVLAPGGVFYFGEEPIGQQFGLRLWNRPTKLRWWEKVLKATLILPFVSKIGKTEIDHGILEEAFSVSIWKEALQIFETCTLKLSPFPKGFPGNMQKTHNTWAKENIPTKLCRLQQFFTGGGISAVAIKRGKLDKKKLARLPPLFCPDCKKQLTTKSRIGLICITCTTKFPKKDTVYIVLPRLLLRTLYP